MKLEDSEAKCPILKTVENQALIRPKWIKCLKKRKRNGRRTCIVGDCSWTFWSSHIAITTFKYNCFELDDLPQFMIAMEKADGIRATTKLKKGEEKHITSFKTMKEASELLVQHQYLVEANRIKNFLDIAGRMRGLTMIAGGFYKALKKGKVKGLDKIKYYLEYWKGFTVRTFNYSELTFRNADPETFSELEQKYKVWPSVVRTALNVSQKFLKKASDATGLDMLVKDLKVQQKHMQTAELVVATNIEDMMLQKFSQETNSFTIGLFLVINRVLLKLIASSLIYAVLHTINAMVKIVNWNKMYLVQRCVPTQGVYLPGGCTCLGVYLPR